MARINRIPIPVARTERAAGMCRYIPFIKAATQEPLHIHPLQVDVRLPGIVYPYMGSETGFAEAVGKIPVNFIEW